MSKEGKTEQSPAVPPASKGDLDQRMASLRQQFGVESPTVAADEQSAPMFGQEERSIRIPRWVYIGLAAVLVVSVTLIVVLLAPKLGIVHVMPTEPAPLMEDVPTPPPPTSAPAVQEALPDPPEDLVFDPPPVLTLPAPQEPTPLPTP